MMYITSKITLTKSPNSSAYTLGKIKVCSRVWSRILIWIIVFRSALHYTPLYPLRLHPSHHNLAIILDIVWNKRSILNDDRALDRCTMYTRRVFRCRSMIRITYPIKSWRRHWVSLPHNKLLTPINTTQIKGKWNFDYDLNDRLAR